MHRVKNVQNNIFTILVMYTFALQLIIGAKGKKKKKIPPRTLPLKYFKIKCSA